ncbi:MAG: hypothetical protein HYS26_00510 [Candidatus Kaiserbacteria bacterium]|nr:MAG: hypothetical protein HYS26_00510 [Candidatus Kaiserbacteria bacterium]
MKFSTRTFIYIGVAAIALTLLAFASWFYFLRAQQKEIDTALEGRGAGVGAPSFGDAVGSTYNNIVSTISSVFDREKGTTTPPRLYQINKSPTAGFGFLASTTKLRFVERSTGYVFDVEPETGALARVSNTLVPRVYEASVSRDGKIIEKTVGERVETSVATITASSSEFVGFRLPDDVHAITFNAAGSEIFAITETASGAVGVRAKWDGTGEKNVFSSAISGWQVRSLSDGRIVLAQNPGSGVEGYAYTLDETGSLTPLARGVGLTVLPRASSAAILIGESETSLTLSARVDASASEVTLPVRTTADKCVWSPSVQLIAFCGVPQRPTGALYLDLRARGQAHTADSFWRVDVSGGSAELLYGPGDILLDVENVQIDEQGRYIAFMNAIDKSFWVLRVAEQ